MNNFTGKISVISYKTGGIKFEGDENWYNPDKTIKSEMSDFKKGDTVTITLGEKYFTKIVKAEVIKEKTPEDVQKEVLEGTYKLPVQYMNPKLPAEERKIIRQSSLKSAVEFSEGRDYDVETVLKVASRFADWIYEKEKAIDLEERKVLSDKKAIPELKSPEEKPKKELPTAEQAAKEKEIKDIPKTDGGALTTEEVKKIQENITENVT